VIALIRYFRNGNLALTSRKVSPEDRWRLSGRSIYSTPTALGANLFFLFYRRPFDVCLPSILKMACLHFDRHPMTLADGPNSLFHEGGTAIVIHASLDDNVTDPAGNAGARIACGVITK
jgi:copper/zinc superoxide dismutase (SODC)